MSRSIMNNITKLLKSQKKIFVEKIKGNTCSFQAICHRHKKA